MLACHRLLFINMAMALETEFPPADAPMAKMLSVLLIVGQWLMVGIFILLIVMALIMLIPSNFRTSLISDLPASLETSTLAGRCLASAVVAVGWFFVLKLLRLVVKALIHGDPFLPKNVSRLRTIWIIIAASEVFRMATKFMMGRYTNRHVVFHLYYCSDFRSFPLWRGPAR